MSNLNMFIAGFGKRVLRFGFTTNSKKNELIRKQILELMEEQVLEKLKNQEELCKMTHRYIVPEEEIKMLTKYWKKICEVLRKRKPLEMSKREWKQYKEWAMIEKRRLRIEIKKLKNQELSQ